MQKQIQEKEEEGRLAFEELELRVSSISAGDDSKSKLLRDLETKLKEVGAEKKHLQTELLRIKEELNSVCSEIKIELKEELETLKENNRQVQINLDSATEKLVKNEDEKKQLVNKVKDLNTQINEYESCKEVLEKNEREYNDKIEAIKAQLVTVEHENEQLKKSIKDKESTLSEIHGKTSVLEQEMEEKVKNIEIMRVDHQKVLASLQDQMQNADNSDEATKHFETRMEILKLEHDHKIQTLDEEIIELKANYEKAILEFESKSELAAKSIAEKETQIEVLTSSISRIEQDQESLNEITNDLNKELVAANEIIASKDQELDNFDQKIEAISKSNIVEVTTIKDEIISMSKKLEDKTNSYKKLEETLQAENKKARQLDHDLEETRQVLAFVSDDHVHFEEAAKKKANELEKEVLDLRNREGSLKGHEQQLIAYQKELQDQITNGEEKESNLAKEIKDLKLDLQDRENQFKEMTKKNNDEILQLKADFELKIRHKKEKETSFKELQMQSIDYQKKLQEQLTVMEHDLEEAKVKAIGHTTEVNKLSSRIQNLNQDLALSYDEKVKMADNISSLQSEIQTLNNDLQDTKVELSNATKSANEKTNAILVENEQLLDKIASLEVSQDSSEQQLVKKILEEKSDELANQKTNHDNELKTLASNLEETAHKMVNEMTNLWLEKEKKWKLQLDSSEDHTSKTVAELEDLKDKLELTNQMMYNAQNMASAKDAEIEELRSSLRINNDDMEGLKKDLKNSQSDKAAQLLEFEDTLVYLEKQVAELKSRNDEYQNQLESQSRKIEDDKDLNAIHVQIENSHEQAVKALIRKYETQIATKEEAFDTESARIRDEAETELRRTMSDFSGQVADLRKELYEKTALYDDLIDRHQAELRAKQDEVDEEVEACNRMYQVKISEVQAEHEIKIKEFEEKQSSNAEDKKSWNWERATSIDEDAVEDLQRTPTREQRQVQLRQTSLSPPPATLAVSSVMTVNDNSQQHCNHTHSLEEATEFEYLKNVLYQYMMGKEAMTLARVLTTVVKFSPDEQQEVIKHEENKQSLFSNLGILPA
jgi:chromosome segregation ATPase